ncbi:hypothetical protein G6O67_000650 [Ophiocordyceps sinensis]|uniref:Cytochrome P450 n=2 Tax=Ophiocordyceps sinensis TaxID=72228 RepID=A0A8H4PZZ9_9HYPO|nr:Cytochrome P450 [Ophiocordyceps sinensis CO18]KAF4513373.1 hypothetical protein G6O67_000650 [Ophiocordyceps sinensis]
MFLSPVLLLLLGLFLLYRLVAPWLAVFVNRAPGIPVLKPQAGWSLGRSHLAWVTDLAGLLDAGAKKFRGRSFQLWGPVGYVVVIPAKLAYPLQDTPEELLSFEEAANMDLMHVMESQHTNKSVKAVLKRKLNPQLSRLLPGILEDIQWASGEYMPAYWTALKPYPLLVRITTVAMGAVFVGPPLNRSEEYSRLANEHVDAAIAAVGSLLPYHVLLRPLVRRLSPLVRTMRRLEREFCQLISRHQEEQDSKKQDFLNGWLRHEMPRSERKLEPLDVSRAILTSCLDGNLSSSQVLTQALVDLAVHPGYMDELRCEMEDAADKAEAQKLSQAQRLALLVRLDSFIQESQRLNPITLVGFSRRTKSTITLSDGTVLAPGINMLVPAASLNRDPTIWGADADEFRGFRFVGRDATLPYSFSAARHEIWTFGQGIHACPGRFLASSVVKAIMAEVIMKYDVRVPNASGRTELGNYGFLTLVDPETVLQFRKRRMEVVDHDVVATPKSSTIEFEHGLRDGVKAELARRVNSRASK